MNLTEALPPSFDFYHLGRVELATDRWQPPEHDATTKGPWAGSAFVLKGDARGLLVVLHDLDLEPSIGAELGNVIASKLATRVSEVDSGDVWISPPIELTESRMQSLLAIAERAEARTYAFWRGMQPTWIRALVFANSDATDLAGVINA